MSQPAAYEKWIHHERLSTTSENKTLRSQKISTHMDILEIAFRVMIQYDVVTADVDDILTFYNIFDNLRIFSGATDFVKLAGREIQVASIMWERNNINNAQTVGGGVASGTVGTNHQVEFTFTLPIFAPRNTPNLEIEFEVGTFDDCIDNSAGGTTNFDQIDIDVVPHYVDLTKNPDFNIRKGSFRIERLTLQASASGEENFQFKKGYMLDAMIIFAKDHITTPAIADAVPDIFDKILLEHDGSKIIEVYGEFCQNLLVELQIDKDQFTIVKNSIRGTQKVPYIYFFPIDDVEIGNNTTCTLTFNAGAAATDYAHVVLFYYKL